MSSVQQSCNLLQQLVQVFRDAACFSAIIGGGASASLSLTLYGLSLQPCGDARDIATAPVALDGLSLQPCEDARVMACEGACQCF